MALLILCKQLDNDDKFALEDNNVEPIKGASVCEIVKEKCGTLPV